MGATTWLGPEPTAQPQRIVSIVPSLTEAVFALGAADRLVARTRFCVRPDGAVDSVPTIRGTKNPDLKTIRSLNPDLILANREENRREHVESLAESYPVCLTNPESPHDVPDLWRALGVALGKTAEAESFAESVAARLAASAPAAERAPRFLYLIWKGPWMAAGHDTYISRLLEAAGWKNALPAHQLRYPELDEADVVGTDADAILFSSEPFAFQFPRDLDAFPNATKRDDADYELERDRRAWLVDGERLSWYPVLTEPGLRYAAELAARLSRRG